MRRVWSGSWQFRRSDPYASWAADDEAEVYVPRTENERLRDVPPAPLPSEGILPRVDVPNCKADAWEPLS